MIMEYKMETIKTFNYDRPIIEKGYANQTLFIDISVPDISIKPVDEKMKDVFIGGKGFDLWLLWHAVKSTTKWADPDNAGPNRSPPKRPRSPARLPHPRRASTRLAAARPTRRPATQRRSPLRIEAPAHRGSSRE